ncbi:protein DEK isoform X2 [Anopheles nili]|uniref:protein DEK isoform X2 n=1 Tax=Anopheles nili TaxID=185578 RepID=UPI00237A563D|nr:protein DEK isoform X2 [Anopheles nili]
MSANAADEEKKLSKMAEEREDDKGSVKSATAGSVAPDDGTSKADSTGTGTDKKLTLKEPSDAKNQTKNTDEKSGDEKSKMDSKLATDGGNGQPEDDADSRDNGNADKPKATAEAEAKGKNRNGAKKLTDEEEADVDDAEKPSGKSLGSIALIDANITKAKVDDLQTLHTIMYDGPAKPMVLRRNLRKFDGFEVAAGSDAYRKRVSATEKLDVKKLAQLAEILALDKKGSKEELAGRICSFLLKPDGDEELPEEMGEEEEEEEDEEEENEDEEVSEEEAPKKKTPVKRGAPAAGGGRGRGENASSKSSSGRPKRSTAGRGYQDYTTSEEEEEETVKVGRGRRARRGSDSGSDYNPSAGSDSDAGKRRSARAPARGSRTSARNVRKRYSDDESEESASDDDFSEEDQRKKKTTPARGNRGRPSTTARQSPRARGRKRKADTESEEEESEEEEEVDSEDSERPKRKSMATVRGGGRSAAVTNNKAKNSTPAKGRGQPKRAAAVTSAKKSKRGRDRSSSGEEDEEEEEEEDEEEPELDDNESEDEKPLVKKAKQEKETDTAAPPSEDDIKEYLKEILDEANLEEITMKTVCKKVYAKYPQHDLSHKKDFIKATVKSLIST